MTKERFMQIAEEVGIASSDWKEDLWNQLPCMKYIDHKEKEEIVRRGLQFEFAYCKRAVSEVLGLLRRTTRD